MLTPAEKVESQAPVAPDIASATVASNDVPIAAEQVAVTVDSKPSATSETSPSVAEPRSAVSNPSPSVLTAQAPSAVTSTVMAPAAKVQPPVIAKAPPVAVSAPAQTSVVPVVSAPVPATTAVAASSKSKSKKKKAGMPTVTMATAPSSSSGQPGTQGENTGRWTAEEHRLFLQGLEQHGKGWKKIASLIKSRTVVQIRTHAQKYFQKLAKARQNGEEGDVAMEGRGGAASLAVGLPGSNGVQIKRRRQTTGTKRKAISSVVTSAQRHGKKMAVAQAAAGVPCPNPPLPAVAPALAPFVLPTAMPQSGNTTTPSITTAHGVISGAALEDSLFRFLTPAPVSPAADPLNVQVNDVARQAGANPITVPMDIPTTQGTTGGEVSPTGVTDCAVFLNDTKDMPTWYSKGADVDCLLDVADTLDWLNDTGDLNETYQPPPVPAEKTTIEEPPASPDLDQKSSVIQAPSVSSFGTQDSVPPLPSLFEGGDSSEPPLKKQITSASQLSVASEGMEETLNVFDTPMDEHAFVSALLENGGESSESLPALS